MHAIAVALEGGDWEASLVAAASGDFVIGVPDRIGLKPAVVFNRNGWLVWGVICRSLTNGPQHAPTALSGIKDDQWTAESAIVEYAAMPAHNRILLFRPGGGRLIAPDLGREHRPCIPERRVT